MADFFDTMLQKLQDIDDARDQAIRDLLQPLLQKEFDKVRRHKPHLEKILFGNGTFAIVGLKDSEDPWRCGQIRQVNLGQWKQEYVWSGPQYMKRMMYLCEWGAEVCLDDVFPNGIRPVEASCA